MKITIYELLGLIKDGKAPKKVRRYRLGFFKDYKLNSHTATIHRTYESEDGTFLMDLVKIDDEVEILDEEEKIIETPQEFLKNVNPESEIVLIQSNLGHDFGYRNSVGFITSISSMGDCFALAFDRIENRWWECRFDKDEYIRTGLFVSDLFKPFVTLTPSKEDEFIDIEELKIGYPEDNPSNKYIVNEYGTKCYLTKHSRIMADKINDLIKNQKKIIHKLKEEGK